MYDATNLRHTCRAEFLSEIKGLAGHTVCVYFAIPLEQALSQNTDRDMPVPEEVIKRMSRELCEPRIDEGWDKIKVIRSLPERNIDRIRKMTVREMAEFLINECSDAVDHVFAYASAERKDLVADCVDWLNRPAED